MVYYIKTLLIFYFKEFSKEVFNKTSHCFIFKLNLLTKVINLYFKHKKEIKTLDLY